MPDVSIADDTASLADLVSRSKSVRIAINRKGLKAILRGPEVTALIQATGQRVQAAAPIDGGEEWSLQVRQGFDRPSAVISTANEQAKRLVASSPQALYGALNAGR